MTRKSTIPHKNPWLGSEYVLYTSRDKIAAALRKAQTNLRTLRRRLQLDPPKGPQYLLHAVEKALLDIEDALYDPSMSIEPAKPSAHALIDLFAPEIPASTPDAWAAVIAAAGIQLPQGSKP